MLELRRVVGESADITPDTVELGTVFVDRVGDTWMVDNFTNGVVQLVSPETAVMPVYRVMHKYGPLTVQAHPGTLPAPLGPIDHVRRALTLAVDDTEIEVFLAAFEIPVTQENVKDAKSTINTAMRGRFERVLRDNADAEKILRSGGQKG